MIINSMLDTDFYKLTMQQVVFHQFPNTPVRFDFRLRNYPSNTLIPLKDKIMGEISNLNVLEFTNRDIEYLDGLGYFKPSYLSYLQDFSFKPSQHINIDTNNNEFKLWIEGNWLETILYEVPVLAIISEIFCKEMSKYMNIDYELVGIKNLSKKLDILQISKVKPRISDFGTRRRYSRDWQEVVIKEFIKRYPKFIGTSNVYFAKKYNINAIGTMAHEFIQAMQNIGCRLQDSQRYAFQCWANEYRGDLGIALSDTLGMDTFFNDFDKYFAKLYDGARHDSGNPLIWGRKLINHYKSMDIDPLTKTAVFSDGLNIPTVLELYRYFNKKINTSFGIGTNLTNDVGIKAPQIVIKMTECNHLPVAKISDSNGKVMCRDIEYLRHLCRVFDIPMERLNEK